MGWNLRSILSPVSLKMYLAPGYCKFPRRTRPWGVEMGVVVV